MPKIEILPATSELKPYEIMTAWQAKPGAVPWVQVGNLYLSCFETGNESWPPIVELLAKEHKRTRFTVCTGRHGDFVVKTGADGQFTGVQDGKHLTEDLKGVSQLQSKLPKGTDLMVLDVTDADFNSVPQLTALLKQNISAGRTVILAWCYSIFAMNQVPSDISQEDLASLAPELKAATIQGLVDKHWAFAK